MESFKVLKKTSILSQWKDAEIYISVADKILLYSYGDSTKQKVLKLNKHTLFTQVFRFDIQMKTYWSLQDSETKKMHLFQSQSVDDQKTTVMLLKPITHSRE